MKLKMCGIQVAWNSQAEILGIKESKNLGMLEFVAFQNSSFSNSTNFNRHEFQEFLQRNKPLNVSSWPTPST